MIKVAYDMQYEGVHLRGKTLDVIAKFFDEQHEDFAKKVVLVHRKSVFQILIRIIRICPVDTGRLRGSWTPLMDKHNATAYQKYIRVGPITGGGRKTEAKGFEEKEFKKGQGEGFFIDELLSSTIGSNVVYAVSVEERVGFLLNAVTWGERRYQMNFEAFIEAMVKTGKIPAVNVDDEGASI